MAVLLLLYHGAWQCGSMTGLAPEVFGKNYTAACDMVRDVRVAVSIRPQHSFFGLSLVVCFMRVYAWQWSAGVVMYVALFGCYPFQGRTNDATKQKILTADLVYPASLTNTVSDDAKDLIQRLLNRNPHERLTPEAALEHPWIKVGDRGHGSGTVVARSSRKCVCVPCCRMLEASASHSPMVVTLCRTSECSWTSPTCASCSSP